MPPAVTIPSSQTAKPYRDRDMEETPLLSHLDKNGYVDFASNDSDNPRNWAPLRKWYIACVGVFLVLNGTLASSLTSGSPTSISEEFGVSEVAVSLAVSLFLLGYCVGPFIFAPMSEFYGRRWIFYITFLLYMASTFLCAFTPTFAGLLVGRFFAGTFASAPLTNVPSMLADLWDPTERGYSMALFALTIWMGPSLGPIIAGFCEMSLGWRWAFYAILWLGALATILVFTLPETHAWTVLTQRAQKIRGSKVPGYEDVQSEAEAESPSLGGIYKLALTRPWSLVFDFISSLCALYMAFVYTLQYMLFSIYPIIFQEMRGWNSGVGQLPLLGPVVGAFFGVLLVFVDTRRRRQLVDMGVDLIPEDRLFMAKIGGIGFPVAMFWLAWTGQYNSIHWIVPTLAGTFLSAFMLLIFVSYTNYFVDTYVQFAASAVAVNTFARSIGSAAAPLFTTQMFHALGIGGGGSLLAGLASLLAVTPFVFSRYGKRLRNKSKYAVGDTVEAYTNEWNEEAGRPDFGEVEAEDAYRSDSTDSQNMNQNESQGSTIQGNGEVSWDTHSRS